MGKTGPELMLIMQEQAAKFGAKMVYETVTDLDKLMSEYDGVILAMGASPRLLGVGEEKYWGKGFSTCAVCDAAFYRGKNVYVVGGGDAAIEDAVALTKFATHVTMLVRGSEFRASKIMQKRVEANADKITVMWKTNLKKIEGERVETLTLDVDGQEQIVKTDGLFFAIGHKPATDFLKNSKVEMDVKPGNGFWPTMTSVEGVFVAGDCSDHRYRQAATAAGMGVQAALDIERWLESK